jgi:uncharacterized protein DUF1330
MLTGPAEIRDRLLHSSLLGFHAGERFCYACIFPGRHSRKQDAATMEEYKARITPVVEKFGGRYLVIGGPFEVLEGPSAPVFLVMIQFPDMDQAATGTTRRSTGNSRA